MRIALLICFSLVLTPLWAQREAKVLFTEASLTKNKWRDRQLGEKRSIERVLAAIQKSPTGSKLIAAAENRAKELGGELIDFISASSKSYTDTTLVRRFKPHHPGKVEYRTRSVVYLDHDLGSVEAILDLSHELTHFTYREPFNPYNEKFKVKGFIASTIEGKGGEVDAYLMECKILDELFSTKVKGKFQCGKIKDPETGNLSRKWAVKRFYQMGAHLKEFRKKIAKHGVAETELKQASAKQPLFYSSAYGVPYPIAAVQEFEWVKEKVCRNDERRISLIAEKFDTESSSIKRTLASLKHSFFRRCSESTL